MFEEKCCEGQVGSGLGNMSYGGGSGGNLAPTPREPGILAMTEDILVSQENLRQLVSKLEEVLHPICIQEPMSAETSTKDREPNLARPDERLRLINREVRKLTTRIESLLLTINL